MLAGKPIMLGHDNAGDIAFWNMILQLECNNTTSRSNEEFKIIIQGQNCENCFLQLSIYSMSIGIPYRDHFEI